ncbi:BURP domain protein RD22-like protein [Tanacetum coccineum]
MFLSQRKYAIEILEHAHIVNCNPSRTLVDTESKLGDDGDPVSDLTLYRSFTGALQYLTFTRPDISYAVQQVSLYITSLIAYSDANWAGCPTIRRLTSSYYVFLGKNLLSWSYKRQQTLSRSSVEVDDRGVANVVAQICWLRNLLRELHKPLSFATLDLVGAGQIRVLHMAMYVSQAANVAPETYWKSMLPNTPMPKAITTLLYNNEDKGTHFHVGESGSSVVGVGPHRTSNLGVDGPGSSVAVGPPRSSATYGANAALVILENDMHQGHEMSLRFPKTITPSSNFLPRTVAEKIPFSSKNLPQLYTRFSIKPDSIESESMKKTISRCEERAAKGEQKYCATSLEAMVDFIISKLGKKVKAILTDVKSHKLTTSHKYTIEGSKKVATDNYLVCHKQKYPYPVFYCHKAASTRVYSVSLVGEDGTKSRAVAVCHKNASNLYPKDIMKVLKVKPGTRPNICHFLPEDNMVWLPY